MRTGLLFAVAAMVAYIVVAPATAIRPGSFYPIDNINDPHIQELGRWAVTEHNKQANAGLTFNRVVSGQQQVVSGMRYRLNIDASNPNGNYRADIYEQSWTNTQILRHCLSLFSYLGSSVCRMKAIFIPDVT
ncbi:hypothetical protein EJB05_07612, partial [Eragrostis curvula]